MGIEILGFAATFAITQTIAAVGFPVFIIALIPIRALVLPKFLRPEELAVLDAPTASPFTMEGIGGAWGGASSETDEPEDKELGGTEEDTTRQGSLFAGQEDGDERGASTAVGNKVGEKRFGAGKGETIENS